MADVGPKSDFMSNMDDPVIRINPYELQISGPEFVDTIYASAASGLKRDKCEWAHRYLGVPGSSLATWTRDHHRLRR